MTKKSLKIIVSSAVVLIIISVILINRKFTETKNLNASREIENLPKPVAVSVIKKDNASSTLTAVGTTSASQDVMIVSETEGVVKKLHGRVGQYRRKDDVLIEVDDELKKASFELTRSFFEKTKKDFSRYEALYKEKAISDSQYEDAKLNFFKAKTDLIVAKRKYDDTKIKSPIAGIIAELNPELGDMISHGSQIANVINLNTIKVVFRISEENITRLSQRDTVTLVTDTNPDIKHVGLIKSIGHKADPSHTYPVEVVFRNNRQHLVRAGMFIKGIFNLKKKKSIVLVPRNIITDTKENARVFIYHNGIAETRAITLGKEYDDHYEVLEGLHEGDQIIISKHAKIEEGDKVIIY